METTSLQVLLISSGIALLIKAWIFLRAISDHGISRLFLLVLSCFLLHNLTEVVAHTLFSLGIDGAALYRALYAIALLQLALVFCFAVKVSEVDLSRLSLLVIILSCVLAMLVASSDLVISTRTDGDFARVVYREWLYPLYQTFCISVLLAIPAVLVIGYRLADRPDKELRCAYMLFALSPVVLICLAVVVIMALELRWNAVAMLPLASSAFLVILYYSETGTELRDLRRFLPYSRERQTTKLINETFARYSRDEISYKECLSIIERELVSDKYYKKGGNASATAESMGLPRSSLYSLFARLDISKEKSD